MGRETEAEIRRDYAPLVEGHAARADGIICPSEHSAREIERLLHVPREKICVTTYGVDPAFRNEPGPGEAEALLNRLGLTGPGILYVGSEEKRKNLGALVAAYRKMFEGTIDAPPLVLVGPGASFDTGKTSSGPRVVSTGYLLTSEINVLMRLSKCLVLVSLDEGFGFPVAEAMTAGLPVVCSSGSSLEEIAGGAAQLVDDPRDEAAIVRGLARVLDDPRRASELRTKGLARSPLFDWTRAAEATLAFYRKLLG